jgi:hypothetical protein
MKVKCPLLKLLPMRLAKSELQTIRDTLYFADPQGRMYLFASRSDDNRRGGDIYLYCETSNALDLLSGDTPVGVLPDVTISWDDFVRRIHQPDW